MLATPKVAPVRSGAPKTEVSAPANSEVIVRSIPSASTSPKAKTGTSGALPTTSPDTPAAAVSDHEVAHRHLDRGVRECGERDARAVVEDDGAGVLDRPARDGEGEDGAISRGGAEGCGAEAERAEIDGDLDGRLAADDGDRGGRPGGQSRAAVAARRSRVMRSIPAR